MIVAGRDVPSIESYYSVIAERLEATFERAPRELRDPWGDLEQHVDQLQADISRSSENTLATLEDLEAKLRAFVPNDDK
jgi:phage terminase Nu1 subunit (DNA packaging protein)